MKYTTQIQKFITSQYIFSATRITFSIVIPSLILAYFGLLKEYFLFPLATSFVGLADMAGPYHRRRNALIFTVFSFLLVAVVASLLKGFLVFIFFEIIIFGFFFSLIGVYGQRLAAAGGLTLVVFSIFVDGQLLGSNPLKSILVFFLGSLWFLIVFMVVSKIQPYKLAGQSIGENYLQLADYLRIKAQFYKKGTSKEEAFQSLLDKQIIIKNLQEETREVVFKTRKIVNESTTQSRLLMLMFLNSIDFYEKLLTTDFNYKKNYYSEESTELFNKIHDHLIELSEEISLIGISLQSGIQLKSTNDILLGLEGVYSSYFDLRRKKLSSKSLENFLSLRLIVDRIGEITKEVQNLKKVFVQKENIAKSLSTGLDFKKFLPQQEKLNLKVLLSHISLKSMHFRHAIRTTIALILGYFISKISVLGIGHSYWILITIVAIIRPAYSTTKHRNILRLYGTFFGAVVSYFILYFFPISEFLLFVFIVSLLLCFTFLKDYYAWAVFFMTIYIFITFNFLNPGQLNTIFIDRILDTVIAGVIVLLVSYFILPVWAKTQTVDFMKNAVKANYKYLKIVTDKLQNKEVNEELYRLERKNAIISLANLSDNFQKLLSDPHKNEDSMKTLHQFVNTSHLITAYIASLSQIEPNKDNYPEIDWESYIMNISKELQYSLEILNKKIIEEPTEKRNLEKNKVKSLILKRKQEIDEEEFLDARDPKKLSYLAKVNNIQEILDLLFDVAKEQRKLLYKNKEISL